MKVIVKEYAREIEDEIRVQRKGKGSEERGYLGIGRGGEFIG